MDFSTTPHRRFNPLINSWILVSPHRINRPWQGQSEKPISKHVSIDSNNPLCPNSIRSNGERNPPYTSIYLFKNDFPALLNEATEAVLGKDDKDELFRADEARGDCFVMCYDPRSNVTLASMKVDEVICVIKKWKDIISEVGEKFPWVQIFENRGEMMGCSNLHPHCQIWATDYVPHIPSTKDTFQQEYFKKHHVPMLHDYLNKELDKQTRIVIKNESWVCLIPFWAEWPFETMLLPRRLEVSRLTDLTDTECRDLAIIIQLLLDKYNKLFDTECPYSMGWHGAPTGCYLSQDMSHWTLHASYFPPLLRSASVRKFFVGFELLAETQRDLTPEKAAELLRNVV